jgi:hypothetical protein
MRAEEMVLFHEYLAARFEHGQRSKPIPEDLVKNIDAVNEYYIMSDL